LNDIEITFFPKSYLYYTANKPFWLVFTTKYMNFSRYYKGAFDPDIILLYTYTFKISTIFAFIYAFLATVQP